MRTPLNRGRPARCLLLVLALATTISAGGCGNDPESGATTGPLTTSRTSPRLEPPVPPASAPATTETSTTPAPAPAAPPAKPTRGAKDQAAYDESKSACSLFPAKEVAREYGASSTDPVDVAQAYASESYVGRYQASAREGCLAGLRAGR